MMKCLLTPFNSENFSSPLVRRTANFIYLSIILILALYFTARITFSVVAKDYEIPALESLAGEISVDTEAISPRIYDVYGETWKMRQLYLLINQKQKLEKNIPMELAAELHDYEKNSVKAFFVELALADRIMEHYPRHDILSHYLSKQ